MSSPIDLTDVESALDDVIPSQVLQAQIADAAQAEYINDVMSITSQSQGGGSLLVDSPEDEEVRTSSHIATMALYKHCYGNSNT